MINIGSDGTSLKLFFSWHGSQIVYFFHWDNGNPISNALLQIGHIKNSLSVCKSFQFFKILFLTFGKRHLFKDVVTKKFPDKITFCFEKVIIKFHSVLFERNDEVIQHSNSKIDFYFSNCKLSFGSLMSSGRYATKYLLLFLCINHLSWCCILHLLC